MTFEIFSCFFRLVLTVDDIFSALKTEKGGFNDNKTNQQVPICDLTVFQKIKIIDKKRFLSRLTTKTANTHKK